MHTRIKLCGLSREEDIEAANALRPEYIGFVFAKKSKRHVSPERAATLKRLLSPGILAVGVFVREEPENIARLFQEGTIDIAQLHGGEDMAYIRALKAACGKPLIQAFRVDSREAVLLAAKSPADGILLDAGDGGGGSCFDWGLLQGLKRPYFLAGGLNPENVPDAVRRLHPYAVDVSSGIETDNVKDARKMKAFVEAVRSLQGRT